jgi:DNA (cytosine-5)-methyltransferase 1
MAISYNKMKKRLIDLDMKPKELKEKAEISQNVMAKINKNEPISVESLEKICRSLGCDIGDIMEFVPDSPKATK